MVQLAAVNLAKPHQLLKEGTLHGEGLNLQLSSLREHVHSRVATIYVAQSSTHGQVALKVVFAPDVREPHDVRKEISLLSCLHHPHVCLGD